MVVTEVLGDVVLVERSVPPGRSASYHRTVVPLAPGVALMVNGPVPQKVVDEAIGEVSCGLIVSVTASRGSVFSQPVVVLKVVR